MKKLLFVTASMSRGGAERVISILSDYYVGHGWDVSIMVLFSGASGYKLNPAVKLIDKSSSIPSRLRVLDCIFKSRKEINKLQPDVVLSFLDSISLIEGFACIGLKTKLVCCERIDPSQTKRLWIFRKLINIIYSKCAKAVVQTKRAFDFFPEKVQKNTVIIPNPVRVKNYSTEPAKRFVTAGRLTKQKNHVMLINAFAKVHEKHSDWVLDIYGDGELEESLRKQIEEHNLVSCVNLKGNVADLHSEIADAGCFVLSSDYEGLSNALLEAMMMGLCCISTNCAGSGEAITNMDNGIIVPVKNEKALSDAMMFVADNPTKALSMAAKAKASSVSYSVDNVIDMWNKVVSPC